MVDFAVGPQALEAERLSVLSVVRVPAARGFEVGN